MTSELSRIARQNSQASISSSSSLEKTAHDHVFSSIHSLRALPSWRHEAWEKINQRFERYSTGTPLMGMTVMTQEILEMHVQQTPEVRGLLDYLPVVDREGIVFVGWRQKLGTWPCSKHERLVLRQFAA